MRGLGKTSWNKQVCEAHEVGLGEHRRHIAAYPHGHCTKLRAMRVKYEIRSENHGRSNS